MLTDGREGDEVRPEEEFERTGQCSNRVISARSVVAIVARVEEGLPSRVTHGAPVAIVLPLADRGNRAPEDVMAPDLVGPAGDEGIGDGQGTQGQQPGVVPQSIRVGG